MCHPFIVNSREYTFSYFFASKRKTLFLCLYNTTSLCIFRLGGISDYGLSTAFAGGSECLGLFRTLSGQALHASHANQSS